MSSEWEAFLQSSAILYPNHGDHYYWDAGLLAKWQHLYPDNRTRKNETSSVNYGSLLLMSSYAASILYNKMSKGNDDTSRKHGTRIGLAIPEGPFLPLFVLVVHSLNISGSESFHPNNTPNPGNKDVVLIPMETDDAPDRLRHILADSDPDFVLVAPGKDTQSLMNNIDQGASIEFIDYTLIVQEALELMAEQCERSHSNIERLYPPTVKNVTIDCLRYPRAISGNFWDVARLVALGFQRLIMAPDVPDAEYFAAMSVNLLHDSTADRDIISHIVYTSGTTGKPKGCVSSLHSLQHYIRSKNKAHSIQSGKSIVFLASAITFDPCLSDVLATFLANATLAIASRDRMYGHSDGDMVREENKYNNTSYSGLTKLLLQLEVTHILCTPTLWATVEGDPPRNLPSLQVVALGGESIPNALRAQWARRLTDAKDDYDRKYPRLLATYGVTEACVYQTCGEIFQLKESDLNLGKRQCQSVGLPLIGTVVHICSPSNESSSTTIQSLEVMSNIDAISDPVIGEVVLSGAQVDKQSSYLNLPTLAKRVFVESKNEPDHIGSFFYRTGDLGYVDTTTKNLHILGRIKGDGMVKVNGIRIELGEIESALIDDIRDGSKNGALIIDCLATTTPIKRSSESDDLTKNQLVAYCKVSSMCATELRLDPIQLRSGIIVQHGALLAILRARCDRRVRKGCTPALFVLINRLPLSPTGKRDRTKLPLLETCTLMSRGDKSDKSLWDCGEVGSVVAQKVCDCLNLQTSQKSLLTTNSNFFGLGGDSLSATRVCRGLYAVHNGILNSRNIGGETGTIDGPFAVKHLLQSSTLGEYVKFLHAHSAFQHGKVSPSDITESSQESSEQHDSNDLLYDYLIEAVSLGFTCLASSLLDLGVNPNSVTTDKKIRLGKVKDRNMQRKLFRANPLHLACIRGEPFLVKKLLAAGCKANTPDAQGSFPIHLACSRTENNHVSSRDETISTHQEDLNRLECVKMLLETTPISIKDGNKQTILHSAARSGHCELLKYLMIQWKQASDNNGIKFKSHSNEAGMIFDWYDRWFRTPVHWAVLNHRIDALRVLLEFGCSASPPKPRAGVSKRSTNVIIESPLEMCARLYGSSDGIGTEIRSMLKAAS